RVRRAHAVARGAGEEPVRRHAPPRGDRARPGPRAEDLLPRRADDGPRPGVARERLGDAHAHQVGAPAHHSHHDALHGRSRQALRPHRDRRSWRAEGARFADEAEGVGPEQQRPRSRVLARAGGLGRSPQEPARSGQRHRARSHVQDLDEGRSRGDAGHARRGRRVRRHRAVALGGEHDARRRVRALHRPRPPGRPAGGQPAGFRLHDEERLSMHRTWAIVERELRRFKRSPILIVISMVFPLVQLVVLGYAFGGNVKHLKIAIVDQDGGVPAVRVRELAMAVAGGAQTFDTVLYADQGQAVDDLRNGRVNGVLTIPPEFSRRVLTKNDPHVALIEDNTDNFVSATLVGATGSVLSGFAPTGPMTRISALPRLDVVEVYPYVPYVQYLLPGIIVMSIFMMVMIGGGIIF